MNRGRAAQCVALPISSHGDVGMSASSLILRLLKQSEGVAAVGLLGLLALSVATFADVIMRGVFNEPIYGLSDLVEIVTPPIVASCFPVALAARQNITIRFLGRALPPRGGQAIELFGQIIVLLVLIGITWRVGDYAYDIFRNDQVTWLLHLPAWPTWFLTTLLLALCVPMQCLILAENVQNLRLGNPLMSDHPEFDGDVETTKNVQ
ncbi:TRAP transporter small permease [Arenibacterium halophilum]|uniref:TRAP transporter small permease protein n=2 Tax=Arenibacterium halophilum TaxID=2583821 RepID=A0ABY2XAR2_9RHOB|nr:TRAP transporter small permease [Arenibacterium halophilum]